MKVIELDVVTDLWYLADVKLSIFLLEVVLDLLPSLQLEYVGLSITLCQGTLDHLVHADTCCMGNILLL